MKKITITLFLILIINQINAQEFSYGIGLGPSISTLSTIGFDSATEPKGAGYLIFAHANYPLNEKFSVDGKLGFDNRKVNYVLGGEYIVSINYLTLNPMLKMDLGGEAYKGAFLKAGIRLSQLLSAKERTTDLNIKEDYKGTNIGAGLSFGGDFLNHFGLELMFDFALTDELKNTNSEIKINSASLLFYIKLDSLLNN